MGKRKVRRQQEASLLFAAETAEALRRGWRPAPVHPPIRRDADEFAVLAAPATLQQFFGVDVEYTESLLVAGGTLGTLAATAVGSAIFNAGARSRAQAAASAQWRSVDHGELFLTNRRFALRGNVGFWEIDFPPWNRWDSTIWV